MFKRLCSSVSAAGLALWGMGCTEGSFSFNYVEQEPPVRVVHVEPAHVCTPACAHYYHDGRYIVVKRGHHHSPGCGHVFDGSRWVVVVTAGRGPDVVEVHNAPTTRVHPAPTKVVYIPPPPGAVNAYVYDRRGSKWLKVSGKHVHGPHCGHIHIEGHWCVP